MESPLSMLFSLKVIIPVIGVLTLLAMTFIMIYLKSKKREDL